jgi:hypothetical protein
MGIHVTDFGGVEGRSALPVIINRILVIRRCTITVSSGLRHSNQPMRWAALRSLLKACQMYTYPQVGDVDTLQELGYAGQALNILSARFS